VPLALPMPPREYRFARMPERLPSHPELDDLRELWTTTHGKRTLPRRSEFDLGTVKRRASHVSIATVSPDGRFQFRLFGIEADPALWPPSLGLHPRRTDAEGS
jgi:hypothetical protein